MLSPLLLRLHLLLESSQTTLLLLLLLLLPLTLLRMWTVLAHRKLLRRIRKRLTREGAEAGQSIGCEATR